MSQQLNAKLEFLRKNPIGIPIEKLIAFLWEFLLDIGPISYRNSYRIMFQNKLKLLIIMHIKTFTHIQIDCHILHALVACNNHS
jgi:hypothetical protein